jgi:hypothetical protein
LAIILSPEGKDEGGEEKDSRDRAENSKKSEISDSEIIP